MQKIFVRHGGDTISLRIGSNETVKKCKETLTKRLDGIRGCNEFDLSFEGKKLKDELTLAEYNIKETNCLHTKKKVGELITRNAFGNVRIVSLTKRHLTFKVHGSYPIVKLKSMIQAEWDIQNHHQSLVYDGKCYDIAENFLPISAMKIRDYSRVHLIHCGYESNIVDEEPSQVMCKFLFMDNIMIEITGLDTVFSLQRKIKERTGFATIFQKIYCAGKLLDDDSKTLKEEGFVKKGMILHIDILPSPTIGKSLTRFFGDYNRRKEVRNREQGLTLSEWTEFIGVEVKFVWNGKESKYLCHPRDCLKDLKMLIDEEEEEIDVEGMKLIYRSEYLADDDVEIGLLGLKDLHEEDDEKSKIFVVLRPSYF